MTSQYIISLGSSTLNFTKLLIKLFYIPQFQTATHYFTLHIEIPLYTLKLNVTNTYNEAQNMMRSCRTSNETQPDIC